MGLADAGHHLRRHPWRRIHADRGCGGRGHLRDHRRHGDLSRDLLRAFVRTGVTSGIVMLLIGSANIFAWLMTVNGVPATIAAWIQAIGGGKTVFLIMSIIVFLPLFALLDGLPGMLMIMPVFVPIAQQLGVDLVHYGILMTTVMGIALFLPPVGVGLYI